MLANSVPPLDLLTGIVSFCPILNLCLFRILLTDFELRGDSKVTWNDVRHVRLWVDGMTNSYD